MEKLFEEFLFQIWQAIKK